MKKPKTPETKTEQPLADAKGRTLVFRGPRGSLFLEDSNGEILILGDHGEARVPLQDLQEYLEFLVESVLGDFAKEDARPDDEGQ